MRPVKVEFQAFGPYAGYESVDFEAVSEHGLFLICGKTGTGKTMILDAMTFALYGKSTGHSRDDFEAMRCTNADFNTATFVKFEFENNGEYYIFERRLDRKRKNLSASYSVMRKTEDGVWQPLFENAKEKALNEKAVEIIGLEYEQFSQVIVLPQGKFERLLTSNSDEKEKILTSIFGEEKWSEIAELLYSETVERKDSLKEKKQKIINSLNEEHCESTGQLEALIEEKKQQLKSLEDAYKAAGYENKRNELQELLTAAGRFGDLHKAERRAAELNGRKNECEAWQRELDNAKRAEKVRGLLESEQKAFSEYEKRKKAESEIRKNADEKKESSELASENLRRHTEKASEIEDKKSLKIQYESKKSAYEDLDEASARLIEAEKAEKAADKAEKDAKEKLDSFTAAVAKLQSSYNKLKEEHGRLNDAYIAGITGELAESLEEGRPCPVCGSITHPHKAVKADDSVTRAMVNAKKTEEETEYRRLQDEIDGQEKAKKLFEEKRGAAVQKQKEADAARAAYEALKKNLAYGIGTYGELIKAIRKLETAVNLYDSEKNRLEEAEKKAKEIYAAAEAGIGSAAKETGTAENIFNEAKTEAGKGLISNGFESEEAALSLLAEDGRIEELQKLIFNYRADVKTAGENLQYLKDELKGKEEPDEKLCRMQMNDINEADKSYSGKRAGLDNEIKRLSLKKHSIEAEGEGIEEKILEAEEDFQFAKKLRGDSGTGLQRYVLGIMFSSVVAAANKMLEMVHGGRYRLFRSDDKAQGTNKRGLELKVFDKNSEEHEGRFVSTLSGGEKFLTSLALSIGMSAVAQKSGIKIEALFIDEGFGSLDEDSIEDAMNVLDSIQKANGLVGIISHVQLLQDRIPTKLKVVESGNGSHIVSSIG